MVQWTQLNIVQNNYSKNEHLKGFLSCMNVSLLLAGVLCFN